jgi:mannose-6-phosphate isomerase
MSLSYPMIQTPVLMEKVWGGRKLERFGKSLPADRPIGESWELSDHPNGRSSVANGPLAGLSLRNVIERHGEMLFGPHAPRPWQDRFPLLVKIIDAAEPLSVQVHPDDAYTAAHGIADTGKTECWVILESEPGAELVVDVRAGSDRAEFAAAARRGQLDDFLVRRRVRAGDFLYIPAGRLHAIGAGIVLAEVQQPSDTTFRVYDWGRGDEGGQSRPLHLEQSLECINFSGRHEPGGGRGVIEESADFRLESLAETRFFYLHRLELRPQGSVRRELAHGFEAAMVVAGEVLAETAGSAELANVGCGSTVLLPSGAGSYQLESAGGATVLLAGVPREKNAGTNS